MVGISDDTYRRWIETGTNVTEAIGQIINFAEKEELLMISAARGVALQKLLDRITDTNNPIDNKDLLAALKYIIHQSDTLANRHGAASDSEVAANSYLRGPQLKAAKSRMGGTHVEVTEDGNKTTVSITKDQPEILDGAFIDDELVPRGSQLALQQGEDPSPDQDQHQ